MQLGGCAAKNPHGSENLVPENLVRHTQESEKMDVTSNNAAFLTAHSRAQQRGKTRLREVEVGAANPAMATAHAVNSAAEHASEPPRKRQHAQPRPVGGLFDNPPSVTVESV